MSLQHRLGSMIEMTPVSLKIAMYLRSLSSSRVLTAIGMIVRTWLFKLADGIDVSMNSVRLRRELDVAAKQLPLNSAGGVTGVGVVGSSPVFVSVGFLVASVAAAAVICASDDEADIELSDEVESEVCVRPVVDGVGVSDVGVGVAVAGEAVVDCDVEPPVSSCLIR
jgi:hypothetical protein